MPQFAMRSAHRFVCVCVLVFVIASNARTVFMATMCFSEEEVKNWLCHSVPLTHTHSATRTSFNGTISIRNPATSTTATTSNEWSTLNKTKKKKKQNETESCTRPQPFLRTTIKIYIKYIVDAVSQQFILCQPTHSSVEVVWKMVAVRCRTPDITVFRRKHIFEIYQFWAGSRLALAALVPLCAIV